MTASVMTMGNFKMRKIEEKVPDIGIKISEIAIDMLFHDSTMSSVAVIPCEEIGYSDEQFYADLKKASKHLDSMVEQALKEDAEVKNPRVPDVKSRCSASVYLHK